MIPAKGYAATDAKTDLKPFSFERREVGPEDVKIDVLFSGVCHSDIHTARNEWGGGTMYPVVPGHEILGRVSAVGAKVSKYKVGDIAAVGCLVDSCRTCTSCKEDLENYCEVAPIFTYSCEEPKYNTVTQGGYSDVIVVDQDFVLKVPETLDLKGAAPLLCAGITTYSPLKHWKVGKGMKVGVIGLGGLGHMGVKFAHAMGAKVVMITTSPEKGEDAKKLGADEVLLSKDAKAMEAAANSFDFLLNTIPVKHPMDPYVALLKRDATMCVVGAVEPWDSIHGGGMIMKRRSVAGSVIGGLAETQEMLDFCGEHNIVSDVEVIRMDEINDAYERMLKSDVKYRFVIDMSTL